MRNMNNISELVKYAFVTLLGTLCLAGCGQDEKDWSQCYRQCSTGIAYEYRGGEH